MTKRRIDRELGSEVHVLEEVVGIDRPTCIQMLDDPDNGDVLQFMSILGKDEYPRLEKDAMETIRREVRDLLGQKMNGR